MQKILITGSSGLIGSEVVSHFCSKQNVVFGIDNNQRAVFFGPGGDTKWNQTRLQNKFQNFSHFDIDIRNREKILDLIKEIAPDVIVHTAAQPSHDYAASCPFDDFDINATGTLNLLEGFRQARPDGIFVHMSTNKVYGDRPNTIKLKELDTRWEYDDNNYFNGINESFSIDNSKHSLFGSSKVAADIMVQEYGKYFNLKTCCLRGGCLTGPNHSGVELHGFLSYLVRCNLTGTKYKVYGYKGKQVRDNIHSYDVANFIDFFIKNPRPGEVYNLGGGRNNSCSILEAFYLVEQITNKKMVWEYIEKNREGDHICYISNLSKIYSHFPEWKLTKTLKDIFVEIVNAQREMLEK